MTRLATSNSDHRQAAAQRQADRAHARPQQYRNQRVQQQCQAQPTLKYWLKYSPASAVLDSNITKMTLCENSWR
jgi:hypothetical protein